MVGQITNLNLFRFPFPIFSQLPATRIHQSIRPFAPCAEFPLRSNWGVVFPGGWIYRLVLYKGLSQDIYMTHFWGHISGWSVGSKFLEGKFIPLAYRSFK